MTKHTIQQASISVVGSTTLVYATIAEVVDECQCIVTLARQDQAVHLLANVLVTGRGFPPELAIGDTVLCWHDQAKEEAAVILGRIGATAKPAPTPDEIVLEATHSLTLRVGDGSITIREDGKILIKGKDLVSHAQRMNRIKGGAVSIN